MTYEVQSVICFLRTEENGIAQVNRQLYVVYINTMNLFEKSSVLRFQLFQQDFLKFYITVLL